MCVDALKVTLGDYCFSLFVCCTDCNTEINLKLILKGRLKFRSLHGQSHITGKEDVDDGWQIGFMFQTKEAFQ